MMFDFAPMRDWDASPALSASDAARVRTYIRDGYAHHVAGRYIEAAVLYMRGLAVDESDPGAMHLAGVAASQLGQHALAADWIGQAIARQHRVPAYHSNLGRVMVALGRPADAARCYTTAIEIDPTNALAWLNLAHLCEIGGDPTEAARCRARAIALDPTLEVVAAPVHA